MVAPHRLGGDQREPRLALQAIEGGDRRGSAGAGGKRADPCRGAARQPQHGAGDDAERALGADQQLLDVIALIGLGDLREIGEHGAVRQHRLEAENALSHGAVAKGLAAAGIGRDHAADGGAVAGADIDAGRQPMSGRGLLEGAERHAGLDQRRPGARVECDDPLHPAQRHDHRPRGGRGAAGNARATALGNDGDTLPAAQRDDRRHRLGGLGEDGDPGGEIVLVEARIECPDRVVLSHSAFTAELDQALRKVGHSGADRGAAVMEAQRAQQVP